MVAQDIPFIYIPPMYTFVLYQPGYNQGIPPPPPPRGVQVIKCGFLDHSTEATADGENETSSLQRAGVHNFLNVVLRKVRELDRDEMYQLLTKPQDDLGSD